MAFSITKTLYDWMHKRRIVSEVAAEMGVKDVTLLAELRPTTPNAKLGADELIPLFQAIRTIGYGKELEGILYQFVCGLRGSEADGTVIIDDMRDHVVELAKSLKMLFECADCLPRLTDAEELARISTMLQTEVLPVVLQMTRIVQSRLETARRTQTLTPFSEILSDPTLIKSSL